MTREKTGRIPPDGKHQATELVQLAVSRYRFAMSTEGQPFAVERDGRNLARMLRGSRESLRAELADTYAAKNGKAPSSSALADALLVLEGRASRVEREPVHLRVARLDDKIVLDLGDKTGRAITVEPGRWDVVERSPVLFRRTELTGALPLPEDGGSLDELRGAISVSHRSWPLVVSYLISTLFAELPHPIPLLVAEQGTGKSTTARRLTSIIDPGPALLRSPPRDLDQWAVAASGSWIVTLDNLSRIPEWLSDALCRAATGEGLVKRRLYSDDALTVLSFRRCVILTAIDPGALRGDLADRLLVIDLEPISDAGRRPEEELDATWREVHPRILGALLDLTTEVLAVLPTIELPRLPRMADFAGVVAAVDQVRHTNALGAYLALGDRIAADVIESDPVAESVLRLIEHNGHWIGTCTKLHAELTPPWRPRDWPRSPRALSGALRRLAPALRKMGVEITFVRDSNSTRTRIVRIQAKKAGAAPSEPSRPSNGSIDQPQWPDGSMSMSGESSCQPSSSSPPPDLLSHNAADGSDGADRRGPGSLPGYPEARIGDGGPAAANGGLPAGWSTGPLDACVRCGRSCAARDPQGRVQHPVCERVPEVRPASRDRPPPVTSTSWSGREDGLE
jgi:hypothetical protein